MYNVKLNRQLKNLSDAHPCDTIAKELVSMVREHIGPVASFKLTASVTALPLTRSGKIMRKSISNLARNKLKSVSCLKR